MKKSMIVFKSVVDIMFL